MSDTDGPAGIFACQECGNIVIGENTLSCCDDSMTGIATEQSDHDVSLEDVLSTVFDISQSEFEICLCVMETTEVTVAELEKQTRYDQSLINRHLNHLISIGVIERRRKLLGTGGEVYVYSPVDVSVVRSQLQRQFLEWAAGATAQVGKLQRAKVEEIANQDGRTPAWESMSND